MSGRSGPRAWAKLPGPPGSPPEQRMPQRWPGPAGGGLGQERDGRLPPAVAQGTGCRVARRPDHAWRRQFLKSPLVIAKGQPGPGPPAEGPPQPTPNRLCPQSFPAWPLHLPQATAGGGQTAAGCGVGGARGGDPEEERACRKPAERLSAGRLTWAASGRRGGVGSGAHGWKVQEASGRGGVWTQGAKREVGGSGW